MQDKKKTIAFYTLGCKVNQYETQMLSERLVAHGFDIVAPEEYADIYIINSCTVTGMADKKSRNYARRSKRLNPKAVTALIGCYAETATADLSRIPEIDLIVGSADKDNLPEIIFEKYGESGDANRSDHASGFGGSNDGVLDVIDDRDIPISGKSNRGVHGMSGGDHGVSGLGDRTRAYIKIEDGCDRYCAFCIVPYARGAVRSRALDEIVREARTIVENGYKELILTGVNAALYGSDFSSPGEDTNGIIRAIDAVSEIEGAFRIRLSSLEPTVVNADYARDLVKRERLCPHLHLSLQSGSDRILAAMGRRYHMDDYLRIVDVLKTHDEAFSITTDLIVGFPGETDDDFHRTLAAVETVGFSKIHVFKYSRREGTRAAEMDEQIPERVKNERSHALAKAGEVATKRFLDNNVGRVRQALLFGFAKEEDAKGGHEKDRQCAAGVLVDSEGNRVTGAPGRVEQCKFPNPYYIGITDNDITVRVRAESDIAGSLCDVRIL